MKIEIPHALACLALAAAPLVCSAQNYPSQPIKIVVPFVPGGVTDISMRIILDRLTAQLGQSVYIDNKPGASGNVGAEFVAKAKPDGYTLLHSLDGTLVINPHIYPKTGFNTLTDFTPVSKLGDAGLIIVATPSLPANNLRELIALAKAKPDTLSFGSSGIGGTAEATCRLLFMTAGVKVESVNYKGGGAAVNDVIGGHIPLVCTTISAVKDLLQSGRVKGIALSSAKRSPAAPSVPTIAESGFPNLVVNSWVGVVAPAGTPAAIVNRLQQAIAVVMQNPDVRQRFADLGIEPVGNTPSEFGVQIRDDLARWGDVVKKANIKIE